MKRIGSHFSFDRHQRNGILLLCFFLTFSQVLLWFVDRKVPQPDEQKNEEVIRLLINRRDSLKKLQVQNNIKQSRPFNPNYLDEFRAYNLGLGLEAYNRLKTFRQQGNQLTSAEQFHQVTAIDDSLFALLSPLMTFPSKKGSRRPRSNATGKVENPVKKDLNTANEDELRQIRGIGDKLSKRIVAYRNYLGGYSTNDQLLEVYHLPEETARRVLQRYEVLSIPTIEKVNVNTASFKALLGLPYIDYELTKKIVSFRQERGSLTNLEQLMEIDSFPIAQFDRIALYLLAE